jgi:hypothetical protein
MEGNLLGLSGEYFYSVAALFSCAAYLLRNILWLRILLVCAAITYIISGVNLGITSMIGWNSAYLVINLFHIAVLLLDKITISLPQETRKIYLRYFSTLSTREFRKLITINGFCIFQDDHIVHEFEVPDRLYIVLRGTVNVVKGNHTIATLKAGDFIGEMSFLSKQPASANAQAKDLVQCAYWTHDDLEKLKLKNIEAYDKFVAIIGCDLVRKLNYQNEKQLDLTTKLDYVV